MNLSSNLNLLFWFGLFFNLPRKATLCLQTVVVVLFYLWPHLDAPWVSLSTQTHMVCVNWANALGNCYSKQLPLCTCCSLDRFSQLQFMCWVVGPAYCFFIVVFWAFFLQLIFSMCALEKTLVFKMRWSCWCCSFGCPGLDVLFCPGNLWPWFGRTNESFTSQLYSVEMRKFPAAGMGCPPTSAPRYILQSIQFINDSFPLSLGFVTV